MIREFWIMLRKNAIINLLLAFLTFSTFYLLFVLLHFGIIPNLGHHSVHSVLDETVTLNLSLSIRSDIPLERLQSFYYDVLLFSDEFIPYSLGFGQPIRIGGTELQVEKFDYNAFNLFGSEFELLEGRNFIEADFREFQGYFPIVLGYQYHSANEVGDAFTAEYFGLEIEFKVIGILAQNQTFANDKGPYLLRYFEPVDHLIFVPSVSNRYVELKTQEEIRFWQGMYSVLARSNLLIEDDPSTIDYVLNHIYSGMAETGLDLQFDMQGERVFSSIETRNLIRHQFELIVMLFASVASIMCIIITILMSIKYRIREKAYSTLMLIGRAKWKTLVPIISETVLFFILIFMLLHEWLLFDSGYLFERAGLSAIANHWFIIQNYGNRSWWGARRWFYNLAWSENASLLYLTIFIVILCLITLIYPVVNMNKLYKKGR